MKIPQLAVRDTTGAEIPGYFNIWRWILPKLTAAERGGKRGQPEARGDPQVGAHADRDAGRPVGSRAPAMAGRKARTRTRPPVFILVCKNTRSRKSSTTGWPRTNRRPAFPRRNSQGFRNTRRQSNTIRVDPRSFTRPTRRGESRRMALDALHPGHGGQDRTGRGTARAGRSIPKGSRSWPESSSRPLHPPGRDVRCIVSVGMLTEGWDCNTVTHIIGCGRSCRNCCASRSSGAGSAGRATSRARTGSSKRRSPRFRRAVRGDSVQGERGRRRRRRSRSATTSTPCRRGRP